MAHVEKIEKKFITPLELDEREKLLSNICHDLRNPLCAIMLSLTLLEQTIEIQPSADREALIKKQTGRIRRSVELMFKLIEDVLDISVLESGQYTLKKQNHHVNSLISDTIDLFEELAKQKSILLRYARADRSCIGLFDKDKLTQVMSDLVSNAINNTPENGTVTISVKTTKSDLIFTVTDTGSGIKEDSMGLNVTRGIVQAHGGKIWIESKVGIGTSFHFTIPKALISN